MEMFLKYRPARPADFDNRVTAARDIFAYDERDRAALVAMWKDLYARKLMHSPVIEDCSPGTGLGVVFLCNIVFVGDAFARHLVTNAPPLSSKYLLQWWQERRPLPFLTEKRIRDGNGGDGVNMLILASGVSVEAIAAGRLLFIGAKIVEWNPYAISGYRLSGAYIEMYDDITYNWAETFGYDCVNDYAAYYRDRPLPPENQRPHLYGVKAERAKEKVAAPVNIMFYNEQPRFGFSPAEKEFLIWAMSGDTDEKLSQELFLSPETLKKRWQSVYSRVQTVAPEIFGPTEATHGEKRGAEKKRTLLAYLEHHMEELRP